MKKKKKIVSKSTSFTRKKNSKHSSENLFNWEENLAQPQSLHAFSLWSLSFPSSHFGPQSLSSKFEPCLTFIQNWMPNQFFGGKIHFLDGISMCHIDFMFEKMTWIHFRMKLRHNSNFAHQNDTNGTLRTKVRKHANFKGVKGQSPKILAF